MGIDLNPFNEGGLFGSGEAEEAKKLAKKGGRVWEDLDRRLQGQHKDPTTGLNVAAGDLAVDSLIYSDDPLDPAYRSADLRGYSTGPDLNYGRVPIPMEWGTSGYEGLGSEFGDLESAYEDYDPDATGRGMQLDAAGYYRNLMDGSPDAQAEASYARARTQAEQRRRANSEAALRSAEARGMGGSGETLLAELVNNQGSATDLYSAGLDRAAMEQARRDAAAGAYGATGRDVYAADTDVATRRASGKDAFATTKAAGEDAFASTRASGLDSWNADVGGKTIDLMKYNNDAFNEATRANWERKNAVGDSNTALRNQAGHWNKVGGKQQQFANQLAVTSGQTGQMGNAASIYSAASPGSNAFDLVMPVMSFASKAYSMGAGGGS